MRTFLALASVAALGGSAAAAPIIGGTTTTIDEYPTVVVIEVGQGLCTGELIAPDWVLTAGHCVTPAEVGVSTQAQLTASVKVHFHTVNLGTTQGTVVRASDTFPHPMFNINNLGSHDIGLIKLATSVTDVAPSPVSFSAKFAPVGTKVTMVGFGATQQGGGGSVGIEFELKNRTSEACNAIDSSLLDANLLCFSQSDSHGKCQGDSGGPSFLARADGKLVIVGVTSFGDQTCSQFGADTRPDAERAFLVAHIPTLECAGDADCDTGHECFLNGCIVTPFQPSGLGATCAAPSDCDSGMCVAGTDGMKCSTGCTVADSTTCPSGLSCVAAASGDATGTCYPAPGDGGGCCDAGGAGGPATMALGVGLVLAVSARRRRAR